jgi:Protein of unknown function (DUF3105)
VRRGLLALAIAGLAATACAVLITILSSRDRSAVGGEDTIGTLEPDRGAEHVDGPQTPASPPAEPPTSGPHRPEPVERDQTELSDDQILEALHLGNVVIAYEGDPPTDVQDEVSGPFDPDLAAAGQAVILARRPGIGETTALAWRHRGTGDLRAFAEAYLGQGPG